MTKHILNAETLRAQWVTSSYSGGGNNCVQAAALRDQHAAVAVRDSKNPSGPALMLRSDAWSAFVAGVQSGEFGAV